MLEFIEYFIEDFVDNEPHINNYHSFIHYQLLGKSFFDLGYRVRFLNDCIEVLTEDVIKNYPDPIDFIKNIENIDISYLIDNSVKY